MLKREEMISYVARATVKASSLPSWAYYHSAATQALVVESSGVPGQYIFLGAQAAQSARAGRLGEATTFSTKRTLPAPFSEMLKSEVNENLIS